MRQADIILVGGFLGAGKTTLLGQAAKRLVKQGKRVGVITNDQAADLVDTEILKDAGLTVEEIAGGCFCCRFDQLIESSTRLAEAIDADVLIGEPVGSCTDISATVLQPLKDIHGDRFRVAPFTVLADPHRLEEVLDPRVPSRLHGSARYILRKQIEEADIIAINKIDLLSQSDIDDLAARTTEKFPDAKVIPLSAVEDHGVDGWLEMISAAGGGGERITEVDYDIYAEGEAVLGWLNASVTALSQAAVDWAEYAETLLETLRKEFLLASAEVGHAKVSISAPGGQITANVTRVDSPTRVSASVDPSEGPVRLVLNARVQMLPEQLEQIVREALQAVPDVEAVIQHIQCVSPGRPNPTHRYTGLAGDKDGRNLA